MLKDMKIGKRLALAFGLVLALMGTVSAAGYWGLETVAGLAREILKVSSPLVEHSQRARANTLGLRRYEKDYFLNIGRRRRKRTIWPSGGPEEAARRETRRAREARQTEADRGHHPLDAQGRQRLRGGLQKVIAQIRDGG